MHIPKAGGTALREALQLVVGKRLVCVYDDPAFVPETDFITMDRAPYSVAFGHFTYGLHERIGIEPNYAACLREPVERAVSTYRWHGTHSHLRLYNRIDAGETLADMIEAGERDEFSNLMTRYLSGKPHGEAVTRTDLDIALERLEQLSLLTTLDRIKRLMPRANASTPREMDARSLDAVRQVNDLDAVLYERALQLI